MARKPPTGTGATLRKAMAVLKKYGKAPDFTYYQTHVLAALPYKPLGLSSIFDATVLRQRFLTNYPVVKHYMAQIEDTDLSPARPVFLNNPLLRPDGRICIVATAQHTDPWEWRTWCDEIVNQPGWAKGFWTPTCLTCIARQES